MSLGLCNFWLANCPVCAAVNCQFLLFGFRAAKRSELSQTIELKCHSPS